MRQSSYLLYYMIFSSSSLQGPSDSLLLTQRSCNIVAKTISAVCLMHSALKLEKKCNFKSTKTHYLHFQKWQKINFCTRKKFKIAFLVVLNFFLVQKLIFCHFWNSKKCVFVLLKLHFFSILEHCAFPEFADLFWHSRARN